MAFYSPKGEILRNLPEQVEKNKEDIKDLTADNTTNKENIANNTANIASNTDDITALKTSDATKITADDVSTGLADGSLTASGIKTEGDIEAGANVEVDGTLTLNSTSDIVFKDGSSFETGGVDLSNYVDLDSSQIITGQKEFHRTSSSNNSYVFINNEEESNIVGVIVSSRENPYDTSSFYGPLRTELTENGIRIFNRSGSTNYYGYYNYCTITTNYSSFSFSIGGKTINMPTKAGTLALTSDIPSVPSYYRHNIQITIDDATHDADIRLTLINTSSAELTIKTDVINAINANGQNYLTASGYYVLTSDNVYYSVYGVSVASDDMIFKMVTNSGTSSLTISATDGSYSVIDNVAQLS